MGPYCTIVRLCTAIMAVCKELSLLSQVIVNKNTELVYARAQEVVNKNIELVYAHAQEVFEILRTMTTTLAGCKEPSLLGQVVDKNIELICACVQEVLKTLREMSSRETEKVKDKVGVLVVLAMPSVIMEGDIVDAPRLNETTARILKEEGDGGKKAKAEKVKAKKGKRTKQHS